LAYNINAHVDLLNKLTQHIESLVKENEYLRNKVINYNKDDEIQRLINEKLDIIKRSVKVLSDKEENDLKKFREQHYFSCKGHIKEIISHTGIGSTIIVKCIKCNEEKNITDMDDW
jgi:hypothetical protein